MKIRARAQNSENNHQITLDTNGDTHPLAISPKATGFGSSANGGELLFLALATCYCNDVYREAAKQGLRVAGVEVEVEGDFGADGEPAQNVTYRAEVTAQASEAEIQELMSRPNPAGPRPRFAASRPTQRAADVPSCVS